MKNKKKTRCKKTKVVRHTETKVTGDIYRQGGRETAWWDCDWSRRAAGKMN